MKSFGKFLNWCFSHRGFLHVRAVIDYSFCIFEVLVALGVIFFALNAWLSAVGFLAGGLLTSAVARRQVR